MVTRSTGTVAQYRPCVSRVAATRRRLVAVSSTMKRAFRIVRRAVDGFVDDDVMSKSAALSYYTLLSFAPLIALGVWLSPAASQASSAS